MGGCWYRSEEAPGHYTAQQRVKAARPQVASVDALWLPWTASHGRRSAVDALRDRRTAGDCDLATALKATPAVEWSDAQAATSVQHRSRSGVQHRLPKSSFGAEG